MKSMIVSWLVTALILLIGGALLGGVVIDGVIAALFAAFILGLVNAFIKPVLFILTLPINLVTLGLFTFVLNALMLGLAAWLAPGFAITNFLSALGLAIIMAILNALIGQLMED